MMMGFGLNLDSIKELDVPAAQTEEEMNLYITVVAASFIVTFLMFFVLEYIVKIYNPSFLKNLSSSNRTLLLTQIQSNIHAIIVCYLSTYVLYQSEELKADYIWGKCQLASVACAVTIGYMAADLLTLIIRWKDVGEWSYVFHHLFSALAFIYIIFYGKFKFFAMIRLLAEYSTIFVNFRHALHMFGMQNSSIYFYNGLMMVFSFTCARMIPLPIYIYCILSISDRPDYHSSLIGKLILWLATCVLDSLNVLWYIKMLKGAVKVWKSHKNNASPSPVSASRVKDIKQG